MPALAKKTDALTRRCAGCRQRGETEQLLRFAPHGGRLFLDVKRRLPGRGAWVHPRRGCIERALGKGGFAWVLKVPVQDHFERVWAEAERVLGETALQTAGLLKRTGQLQFGRDEVLRAIVDPGKAAGIWLTADAAERTRRAMTKAATEQGIWVVTVGLAERLGGALGRERVAVIAVPANPLGDSLARSLCLWAQLAGEAMVYKLERCE